MRGFPTGRPLRFWTGRSWPWAPTPRSMPTSDRDTEVIDLEGQLAIPGFIDSHVHFSGIGTAQLQLKLMDVANWDEVVEMVAAAVAEAEPGELITGPGLASGEVGPDPGAQRGRASLPRDAERRVAGQPGAPQAMPAGMPPMPTARPWRCPGSMRHAGSPGWGDRPGR